MKGSRLALAALISNLILSISAFGSEIGYSQAQSSGFDSQRLKLAYTPSTSHKFSLTTRRAQLKSDVEDKKTSSLKIQYRHRWSSGTYLSIEGRKGDESYFYELRGVSLRTGFEVTPKTQMHLGIVSQKRSYSLERSEFINETSFNVGVDQTLSRNFSLNLFFEKENYNVNGDLSRASARNSALAGNEDINSYIALLFKSSASAGLEYNHDFFALGINVSTDNYAFSSGQTTTTDLHSDIFLGKSWTLGFLFSRGRIEGSTQNSDSFAFSLGYAF